MIIIPEILHFAKDVKAKKEVNKEFIWDVLRKKWLAKLPEEFVRQCFILYLSTTCSYSLKKMQIERKVKLNERVGRFDLLIVDWSLEPFMLIECKSFDTVLAEAHFHQVVNYNLEYKAPFICLTNGTTTGIYQKNVSGGYSEVHAFPDYPKRTLN